MKLKSACLLLSLCHAGSAAALGLGDLNVRSYLGQPLHATIKIIGASAKTDADCFSVAPSEGAAVSPPRAQLSLERTGDQTLLHVRTPHALNDPITQFALASDCESRLKRDYVVLLDPPSQTASTLSQNAAAVTAQETLSSTGPTPPASPPASKRKSKLAAIAPHTSTSSSRQHSSPPRDHANQTDSTPRLVLSGRRGLQRAALSLRYDTNLPDLNRLPSERQASEKLTPDELSDENTALTRKLAHLEVQLAALQKRNAEIETRRADGLNSQIPHPGGQSAQWPVYLLLLGLLVAAGGLIILLSRRGRAALASRKASWSPASEPTSDIDKMTADPWTRPTPDQVDQPEEPGPILEFITSNPAPTTEVKDDILDQAEVYMAHGHGDLAIHLLQEHLREAPAESPVPWLLLLDLLHREGDTAAYTAASAECRRHFNVNLNGHPVSQDNETSQGIEAYPHLLEQLVVVWGSPVIENFFNDLIFDKRGGTRIGFEPSAYRDILLLRAISRDVMPLAA